ncbi:hypothetical protein ACLOJK_020796 [Asimina triloba]
MARQVEILAVRHDETYKDQRSRFICGNEFMLKVKVKLSFKFEVAKVLNAFELKGTGEIVSKWGVSTE